VKNEKVNRQQQAHCEAQGKAPRPAREEARPEAADCAQRRPMRGLSYQGTYYVRAVALDDAMDYAIMYLHLRIFGSSAHVPVPSDEGHWWVVYHDGSLVGFAGMKKSASTAGAGYFMRSGVMKDHRGHALQRRLIVARERKARRLGFTQLVTDTNDNFYSARNLKRAGFEEFTPPNPWGGNETIYWRKQL
jgi:GNAT superfamily N-acetyltransferase